MNGGCRDEGDELEERELHTIHLTPYQGAPFDLHVASWENGCPVRGFYERRKKRIERYLQQLSQLDPQELSDLVYRSIESTRNKLKDKRSPDIVLARDVQQVRTLSMLAAGFGGKHLAAVFRCMMFDYRHFIGGLPDLLLVRAKFATCEESLVNLGEWVGEAFSDTAQQEVADAKGANMLIDRDDEFLGCNKLGDSAARSSGRFGRSQRQGKQENKKAKSTTEQTLILPPKLELMHEGKPVRVECMFVEVKSANDRLDPRQEDWLNVLDGLGNARVCKFQSPTNLRKKQQQSKPETEDKDKMGDETTRTK
jgi:hypothetical protein